MACWTHKGVLWNRKWNSSKNWFQKSRYYNSSTSSSSAHRILLLSDEDDYEQELFRMLHTAKKGLKFLILWYSNIFQPDVKQMSRLKWDNLSSNLSVQKWANQNCRIKIKRPFRFGRAGFGGIRCDWMCTAAVMAYCYRRSKKYFWEKSKIRFNSIRASDKKFKIVTEDNDEIVD